MNQDSLLSDDDRSMLSSLTEILSARTDEGDDGLGAGEEVGQDIEQDKDSDFDDFVHVDANELARYRRRQQSMMDAFQGTLKELGFKAWLWRLLSVRASKFGHHTSYRPSFIFEAVTLILIVLNTIVVVLYSDDKLADSPGFMVCFMAIQVSSLIYFTLEYIGRLWSCVTDERYCDGWRGRFRWARKPLSLLDLFCLVPFYIDAATIWFTSNHPASTSILKSIQLLRVFTFLRLERQSKSFSRLRYVFQKKSTELSVAAFLLTVLTLVSAVLMFFVERWAQPEKFSSVFAAMWFSIVTLTTVGYGDVVPITAGGKILGSLFAISSSLLFALPAGILGSGFVEILYEEREMKKLYERERAKRKAAARSRQSVASMQTLPPPPEPGNAMVQAKCPCCDHSFSIALSISNKTP